MKHVKIKDHAQGLYRKYRSRFGFLMEFPTYPEPVQKMIMDSGDPVRFAVVALALSTVMRLKIPGALAEAGVYRGELSKFIHSIVPDRLLYLFDTFSGFPSDDLKETDERFRETNESSVMARIAGNHNVVIRKGYFPDTTKGLENESFAFVMTDFDLYNPTRAALEFFYPRLLRGGYLFLHDYNSPESDHAISRATDEFFQGRPETPIEIPDRWGSVLIRKS